MAASEDLNGASQPAKEDVSKPPRMRSFLSMSAIRDDNLVPAH